MVRPSERIDRVDDASSRPSISIGISRRKTTAPSDRSARLAFNGGYGERATAWTALIAIEGISQPRRQTFACSRDCDSIPECGFH